MRGLDPRIHLRERTFPRWVAGSSPATTIVKRRKFAENDAIMVPPRGTGTLHDRQIVAAEPDLGRRYGHAVVRARGHAAVAGGVGVPGHDCDPRRRLRIVAGQD